MLLGISGDFFIVVFGGSMGENIRAGFSPKYERFLRYSEAQYRYKVRGPNAQKTSSSQSSGK